MTHPVTTIRRNSVQVPDTDAPADGDLLTWDATRSEWIPITKDQVVEDVIGTGTTGQVLTWHASGYPYWA